MESIISLLTPKRGTHYLLEGTTLRNALEKFKVHKFSVIPVLNREGKYVRTISEGDLLRYITGLDQYDIEMTEKILIDEIESYRSYEPLKIDATMVEILTLSLKQNFIPLCDDRGFYIGIVKRKEVLAYLLENRSELEKEI